MHSMRILTPITLALALAFSTGAFAVGTDPTDDAAVKKDDAKNADAPKDKAAPADAVKDEAPAADDKAKTDKPDKKSEWRDGYRIAVSFVQDGRYDDAIAKFVSLEKTDSPDVLNYIGYANRKLGRMDEARKYYEAALSIDPNHRGALEYYGEWQVEAGKLDVAHTYLLRLAQVCGTSSREYLDLAEAIASKTVH